MKKKTLSTTQLTALKAIESNNGRIGIGRVLFSNGSQKWSGKVEVTHRALMRAGALKLSGNTVLLTDIGRTFLGGK